MINDWRYVLERMTESFPISNKSLCVPANPKAEPEYIKNFGWRNGYNFKQFLGNVHAHLGSVAKIDGVQQLIHQYYLQNGGLNARDTSDRIKKFLGE